MSISSISPVSELEQGSETTTTLQRWAASLQDVPQPQQMPQLSLQPASQAPGGNLMNQLGTLFEKLVPLLKQLVSSLSQQSQPLLDSLSGASPAAGPSPLGLDAMQPKPVMAPMPAQQPPLAAPAASPSAAPAPASSAPVAAPAPVSVLSTQQVPVAHSVKEAASRTQPQFMPVLRGDEQQKDSQIKTQADFGRAADQVAREYGLDPNLFRAQLQQGRPHVQRWHPRSEPDGQEGAGRGQAVRQEGDGRRQEVRQGRGQNNQKSRAEDRERRGESRRRCEDGGQEGRGFLQETLPLT